ncbi:MAG: hypothetical protein ACO3A2_05290 [Bdellovibrionia bacterium]
MVLIWLLFVLLDMPTCRAEESALRTAEGVGLDTQVPEGKRLSVDLFSIFYGPSFKNPTSHLPNADGRPDPNRTVGLRNFLSLGYQLSPEVAVSGTAFWTMEPYSNTKVALQDPFVKVSDSSLWREGGWNLYGDLRTHFGMTPSSRESDLLFALQSVQGLSYEFAETGWVLGVYGSEKSNVFGKYGVGYDLELYVAPHIHYAVSPTLMLSLLYEVRLSHLFGDPVGELTSGGTDLEPGVTWNLSPSLMLNPYLTLNTTGKLSLSTTTFGLMLNWNLL